jgi:hypothetical protein
LGERSHSGVFDEKTQTEYIDPTETIWACVRRSPIKLDAGDANRGPNHHIPYGDFTIVVANWYSVDNKVLKPRRSTAYVSLFKQRSALIGIPALPKSAATSSAPSVVPSITGLTAATTSPTA